MISERYVYKVYIGRNYIEVIKIYQRMTQVCTCFCTLNFHRVRNHNMMLIYIDYIDILH